MLYIIAVLTQVWTWRATFYFLSAFGGILLAMFCIFKDTFRRERSLCYQTSLKRMRNRMREKKEGEEENKNLPLNGRNQRASVLTAQDRRKEEATMEDIHLLLSDLNPFPPLWEVLARKNNLVVFVVSGELIIFISSPSS
jgi:hypothetical protein